MYQKNSLLTNFDKIQGLWLNSESIIRFTSIFKRFDAEMRTGRMSNGSGAVKSANHSTPSVERPGTKAKKLKQTLLPLPEGIPPVAGLAPDMFLSAKDITIHSGI